MKRMWRQLPLALVLAAWSLGVQAAAGFLWKVEGGSAPLYLVGSVHVMPPKTYPLAPKFQQAYAESKLMVFESDLDAIQQPELQRQFLAAGIYPEGESVQTRWPEDLRKDFAEAAAEIRLPVELFARSRPWLAALSLELNVYQREGFEARNGIDQYFYRLARADNKSLITLESPKAQLSLFTDMPDALGESYLRATIATLEAVDFSGDEIYDLWQDADAGELEDQLDDLHDDQPDIYNRFIAQRNRAWLSPVVQLIKDGKPAMVVVGAMHLPGPDGLIAGLKTAGYKVRPVKK